MGSRSLRCGEPGEGECITCADPSALVCEYDGLVAGHRPCRNLVCMKHCKVFQDLDDNIAKVWCNSHGGERPGKYAPPTRSGQDVEYMDVMIAMLEDLVRLNDNIFLQVLYHQMSM
eukprot:966345-Amphidinium_carterae.2